MIAVREIILPDKAPFDRYIIQRRSGDQKRLESLSRINLFVGANNSGKSRFMRELARIKKLEFVPGGLTDDWHALRREFYNGLTAFYTQQNVTEPRVPLPNLTQIPIFDLIQEGESPFWRLHDLIKDLAKAESKEKISYTYQSHTNRDILWATVHNLALTLLPRAEQLVQKFPKKHEFSRVYLPTLRGLRRLGNAEDVYGDQTRLDYFNPSESNVTVFTGQTLYEDIKKLLLGTLEDREIVGDFQNFLGKAFFHGQPVALIPRHGSNALHVKIGQETEYPIHELGDGIQAIITLTFPLFRARWQYLLVFIEEPELFLHPGLQRLFLNVLTDTADFGNFQYFVATHSNHFLDLTLDLDEISVFTFRKEFDDTLAKEKNARFVVENVSNEDDQTLQLLGVKNSSVFFSNCTIWVERITDRRYISKYISLYEDFLNDQAQAAGQSSSQRFKQDLHYSFVEYSGGNITHWSFLDDETDAVVVERVCAKLFLITDKDEAKAERHEKLKKKLGDRYCCLTSREIENLLAPDILGQIVWEYEGEQVELAKVNQSTYAEKPLGKFIESNLLKNPRKRRGSYAAESGTVSDKLGFCQRALKHLTTFSDLSTEAQELTKRVYAFIRINNP